MRALLDIEFDDDSSKLLSTVRYHDCVVDRLPQNGETIFNELIKDTRLRY